MQTQQIPAMNNSEQPITNLCNKCEKEIGIDAAILLRKRMSNSTNAHVLIINDTDDEVWGSQLINWLMKNFDDTNFNGCVRFELTLEDKS